ncbi:riboflavin biosynthesis protein RibF [Gleimia coleocanis DSM 15436]|uniref:Riboflavin biosynthesis protein n=1 Tax=Gleimia coleocanis DSM 15436 TaxID=525245 RepID=C0W0C9_9ACTO|nr:bifunctional riboflavin kinase/FAD synthetase [Gleimia coleocanis]EEH63988.1 riboflavin biosynthesis protein RibF [Gleimia coleocanis DSM 15436]
MQIWRGLSSVSAGDGTVVTIGNFDGVHRGHQVVLEECRKMALELGVSSVAITFDPHPLLVHCPQTPVELITSLSDRLIALENTGLDVTAVLEYVPSLYTLTASEFVTEILVKIFHVKAVVLGQDAHFGAGKTGNVDLLNELGRELGFQVKVVADRLGESGRRWSSTWARELLATGDVSGAAEILGAAHTIRGVVQHGFKRGRELGFPTANLDDSCSGIIPADGVYAGWLQLNDSAEKLPAAISVGSNPQFAGQKRTIETHVLGRSDLDLYGKTIVVHFVERLRGMQCFDSLDELLLQMDADLLKASEILEVAPACRVNPAEVTAGV